MKDIYTHHLLGMSTGSLVRKPQEQAHDNAAFRQRLAVAARRVGSYYELAKRAGIEEETLRKYRVRASEPSRPILVALARGAGVSVGWLAGEEAPVSLTLLREVIAQLEEALDGADAELTPSRKAELIIALYLDAEKSGSAPKRERILALIRKAA